MSLCKPHPLWTTAGSNPYEVSKAIQQARFLSGRYRTESLTRHWSKSKNGYCQASTCYQVTENVEHILLHCTYYDNCRRNLKALWLSSTDPIIYQLVLEAFSSPSEYFLQFTLDCSTLPNVINASQCYGSKILDELFYLTRTWCFSIH